MHGQNHIKFEVTVIPDSLEVNALLIIRCLINKRTKHTTREVGKSRLLMLLAVVSCPGLSVLNFRQVEPLLAMSK